ncbi:hypothetical protein FHG87_016642 [Trinorchestia longiramus]|nr:hypothetical protein FHG87_016642 [Trinorchestia longiramus]
MTATRGGAGGAGGTGGAGAGGAGGTGDAGAGGAGGAWLQPQQLEVEARRDAQELSVVDIVYLVPCVASRRNSNAPVSVAHYRHTLFTSHIPRNPRLMPLVLPIPSGY